MSKYIDILVPTWYRYTIDDNTDLTHLIDNLENGNISNIINFIDSDNIQIDQLTTGELYYDPIEIEIYDEYNELIYENNF